MNLDKYHKNGKKKTKEEILESILSNYKVKCRCGHTLIIVGKPKVICNHCGYYVYKNKQEEFKDRMTRVLHG